MVGKVRILNEFGSTHLSQAIRSAAYSCVFRANYGSFSGARWIVVVPIPADMREGEND
jgi:hypothetical protein